MLTGFGSYLSIPVELNPDVEVPIIITTIIHEGISPEEIISRLYLRCLGREPTLTEREALGSKVAAAAELDSGLKPALEDVFWALLNSREFLFQH